MKEYWVGRVRIINSKTPTSEPLSAWFPLPVYHTSQLSPGMNN
ncbi:hypothetical protein M595_1449 [Lyngbya aestuarii BL J]|uniref:Uncharacterized protein n=1 Tax=Lyngbya aestuarii BL J TaxID=1348334 RepID=U7QQF6_9CYAN|nr:hypothetical protein M595_1449 [Lyngbya aestuarii BL J]